ncbi:hypothetical protein BDN70DRAFT_995147 [Pholiota conissans]|uniref:Uncharacterized protein n=1 Tax=Pholiota conissans TaxID=109636 RepID=A0A9P5YZ30_9AGAR|nr:hypothetical protein BDN70DRAFT_995147 [Pholiota conissans]
MPDIILDDRDSSINYVGQWVQGGLRSSEYQATTMHCIAPASGTSATLSFVGTGVAVYGTVLGNDIQASSYKVDDSDPINFKSNNSSAMRFLQQFFSIPEGNLSNNSHTLVITPVKGTLSLDFMTVHMLSLFSNAPSPPPPHNNNIGLIVGAVVGALGLICAVVTMVSTFQIAMNLSLPLDLLPTGGINVQDTLGAVSIGALVSLFLFGATTLQTYMYLIHFRNDDRHLKALVAVVWICELSHCVTVAHMMYYYTILKYGDLGALTLTHPPISLPLSVFLGGLETSIIKTYFAERVRIISGGKLFVPIPCWILSAGLLGMATTTSVMVIQEPTIAAFQDKWQWMVTVDLCLGVGIEVILASSFCYYLSIWKGKLIAYGCVSEFPFPLSHLDTYIEEYSAQNAGNYGCLFNARFRKWFCHQRCGIDYGCLLSTNAPKFYMAGNFRVFTSMRIQRLAVDVELKTKIKTRRRHWPGRINRTTQRYDAKQIQSAQEVVSRSRPKLNDN